MSEQKNTVVIYKGDFSITPEFDTKIGLFELLSVADNSPCGFLIHSLFSAQAKIECETLLNSMLCQDITGIATEDLSGYGVFYIGSDITEVTADVINSFNQAYLIPNGCYTKGKLLMEVNN